MTATPSDPHRRDPSIQGSGATAPGQGLSPPGTGPTGGPDRGEASDGGGGTTQTARREAGRVGESAGNAVKDVASTTREQGERVVGDVRAQARRLTDETRSQVNEQATSQRDRAVDGLRSLSDELRGMAERSDESGMASGVARQGADAAQRAAEYLAKREPGQLLDDIRGLARRRPGAFLLGAAALGVVAGRLSRGMIDSHRDGADAGPRDPLGSQQSSQIQSARMHDLRSSERPPSGLQPPTQAPGSELSETQPYGTGM